MATRKKRTAAAIGRQNRARGGAYERWVAKQVQPAFPGARRGIGQARTGGDVPDVEGCGDWWAQCKSTRAPNLFDALAQAEAELLIRGLQSHAPCPYRRPLAVARRTGKAGDIVAMRLQDFVRLAVAESAAAEALVLIDELRHQLKSARAANYELLDGKTDGQRVAETRSAVLNSPSTFRPESET